MLHEADLAEFGAEGTALFGIEHHVLKSVDPKRSGQYSNCFYACKYCNDARHTSPNRGPAGEQLLEPCSTAWAQHFALNLGDENDRLVPVAGDAHAEYTATIYDINAPGKCKRRASRRRELIRALRLLREAPDQIRSLSAMLADASNYQPEVIEFAVEFWEQLHEELRRALRLCRRYQTVPSDRPERCRCASAAANEKDVWLWSASVDVTSDYEVALTLLGA